jgi:hypothetical protein
MRVPQIDLPWVRPMMEYGRASLPEQPAVVLVRNATVWTQGPQGRMENADLLVRAGKVVQVGRDSTRQAARWSSMARASMSPRGSSIRTRTPV